MPKIVVLPVEVRRSDASLPVFARPDLDAELRGRTAPGASFRVVGRVNGGPGCAAWAQLEARGYACLDSTEPSEQQAVAWPEPIDFDPPSPSEFERYLETGEYEHKSPEPLTPAVYAKRWRRFEGHLYASLDAFVAGEAPTGQLLPGAGNKYRFERIVETERGPVLTREDGRVARLDDVYLYPITRLMGHDLRGSPLPGASLEQGPVPAFVIAQDGAPLRRSPSSEAEVAEIAPYHAPLRVRPASVPGWWTVQTPSPLFLQSEHLRRATWAAAGRPAGVAETERWIDVDLAQQALMVYEGDALIWFTLVSSGAGNMATPTGTWTILEKHGMKDMVSRPGAADTYRVEDVPWTMVFKPRYSLHTAYWHWGFGRPASHGCVNLAPRDARWLYEEVGPKVPAGWSLLYVREDEGGVVRIRRGEDAGEDRRQVALLD